MFSIFLCVGLGAICFEDIRSYRIPNVISLPLIVLGIAYGWWLGTVQASVLGAIVGYGSFVVVERLYFLVRKRAGLGRGDAKLFAVGGAWCGWEALPAILLIASLSGLLFALATGRRNNRAKIAFAPFLAFGIAVAFFAF